MRSDCGTQGAWDSLMCLLVGSRCLEETRASRHCIGELESAAENVAQGLTCKESDIEGALPAQSWLATCVGRRAYLFSLQTAVRSGRPNFWNSLVRSCERRSAAASRNPMHLCCRCLINAVML